MCVSIPILFVNIFSISIQRGGVWRASDLNFVSTFLIQFSLLFISVHASRNYFHYIDIVFDTVWVSLFQYKYTFSRCVLSLQSVIYFRTRMLLLHFQTILFFPYFLKTVLWFVCVECAFTLTFLSVFFLGKVNSKRRISKSTKILKNSLALAYNILGMSWCIFGASSLLQLQNNNFFFCTKYSAITGVVVASKKKPKEKEIIYNHY